MLSYLHTFHAGNFADVHKHCLLWLALDLLQQKPKPLVCYDTHAGHGLYDLGGSEAQKTGEWQQGIGRLWNRRDWPEPLAGYRALLRQCNPKGGLRYYPGSPYLMAEQLRPADRLIAMEQHPRAGDALQRHLGARKRVILARRDGHEGLVALSPPPERRGLVLMDPSYEVKTEFAQAADSLIQSHRRWGTGCFFVWYPLLAAANHQTLIKRLVRSGIKRIWQSELLVADARQTSGMYGSGVLLINPPWPLEQQCETLMPWLLTALQAEKQGSYRQAWLVGEN